MNGLIYLSQSMSKLLSEEVAKESKLLHTVIGCHNDPLMKLSGRDKRSYDGQ